MKQIFDYHVHTSFCDGANTPREMVKTAISKGFDTLGFSGHGYTDFDLSFCMSAIRTDDYIDTIRTLKEEYKEQLHILCGIEKDYFSSHPTSRFDYVIGSVHYLYVNGKYVPLDMEVDTMRALIDEVYGGDFSALACDYYKQVSDVVNKTECDIIGHFDLITKFKNRTSITFDERYFEAAFSAIDALIPFKKPFEINLGAIARGYRGSPYPDLKLLKYINERGGEIVITGDCHNALYLGANFEKGVKAAKSAGFDSQRVLTKNGWELVTLP
jgi:histidinol-phosphatase (PHP family)